MRDFLEQEIKPGDKVLYAWRRGSSHGLAQGVVTEEVTRSGRPALRVISRGYDRLSKGDHEIGEYMVVIGSVPVTSLDRLKEAYAADRDAEKKTWKNWHPGAYDELQETHKVTVGIFDEVWG